MTTDQLLQKLELIARKVELLKKENFALKEKLETQQNQYIELKTKVDLKNSETESLQKQLKSVKLAMFLSKEDKQSIKLQINKMIEDINTSINLLTQQNGTKSEQDSNKA
ncbi:MAG: hypothetical protein SGJ10_04955 [Bacteroidota bacterium]|nr:hypothetical protein [Bacteroidota bacterium]